ncbi:MAG TPA: Hsp20/alpha crystallin family protein [Pyrinomonadaceae bacterium]|nr:Hsp20/alpha crystallin family protein [Pyrinomonadaceae bacterium]
MAKTKTSKAKKHQSDTKQKSSQSLQETRGSNSPRTDLSRREQFAPGTTSPFTFMRRFSEEMDRLFEDFGFGRGLVAPTFESSLDRLGALGSAAWSPQVEVFERDNQLVVRADLPGMTRDDITVDVNDDALIIRGERKSEREENEEGYYRSERSYGSVYRRIPLPQGVNAENARADFRNGVLEIKMPASQLAEQRRRQIEIRGEAQAGEQPQTKAKAAGQR